ncbi:MAG TPA: TrbI/VirB10 family protein [Acetobacteraceae bacterium]|nr:TrbI/VirB10 family protein [Acetobacteraceae bacterium]
MRSLFSSPSPDDPVPVANPASGGWNGLSGRAKLGIAGGVAVAAMTAVMWPGFNSKPAPAQPTMADQHPAARISDYEAPPPVADVAARVMGDPPAAYATRHRPAPTEMSLYTAPRSTAASPAATAPAAVAAADPAASFAGLPPTNRATLVKNPDFLIRAGDVIPCLPIDAQNSSRPGFSTCSVPTWFRSSNQRRGLLPPHSRLFGQIRSGLQAGEERLGIVYSLIQTPNFNMPIAAPAGDAMGRGGVDGDVQTFFWDRAGAVALYALMDVAVGTGQNLASSAISKAFNNSGTSTSLNFTGPSQSLASHEFDATINRPPVLTRDQALPVTVTVGQDLDFSDACIQAMRVDPMACPLQ